MDQFKQKFLEEASDILIELEDALLQLEKDTDNSELIDRVFRAMHTLKGTGGMFGFNLVSSFTHQFENLFDSIRKGDLKVNRDILNLTFESIDHIRLLLDRNESISSSEKKQHDDLLQRIEQLANVKWAEEASSQVSDSGSSAQFKTYFITFDPKPEIMNNGTNPLYIIDELCSLGKALTFADTDSIQGLDNFDAHKCYIKWHIVLATDKNKDSIRDVFIFVEDDCRLDIVELALGNLLDNVRFTSWYRDYLKKNKPEAEVIKDYIKTNILTKDEPDEERLARLQGTDERSASVSTIRVISSKLDELMSIVSELVTVQARLSMFTEKTKDPVLETINEEFEKITRQLRDNVINIRLVPLNTVVTRFNRLVRELANSTGKEIEFITEGIDTELDKNSIELLVDPILHIIRNSVDHGIESPEARIAAGKPARGTVILKAFYSGSNVCIEISDDGKGISPEVILKRAIETGLVRQNDRLTEKEILNLIFLPGFSTAEKVTNISGRGVGMDVVKKKMAELHGDIDVISTPGKGTTISLTLPLTLSIIDGLLVSLENQIYVIPLTYIDRCARFEYSAKENAYSQLYFTGAEYIPFIYLREFFKIDGAKPEEEHIIIVKHEKQKVGLVFDKIIGEHQAVLKQLGRLMKKQDFISGGSILGDGSVALVIDTQKIIKRFSDFIARSQEKQEQLL